MSPSSTAGHGGRYDTKYYQGDIRVANAFDIRGGHNLGDTLEPARIFFQTRIETESIFFPRSNTNNSYIQH